MAFSALSLSTTTGVQGRPYRAVLSGLQATSTIEMGGDGSPGFSYVNGRFSSDGLPYPVSTLVFDEIRPGEGRKTWRFDISAAGAPVQSVASDGTITYTGAGGGAPTAQAASATASGPVFTITRLLGSSSTLALVSGTNTNLTLNAATGVISATATIGAGVSQTAQVSETSGSLRVDYPVVITGVAAGAALAISGSLTAATVGDTGAFTPAISGGTPAYTLSLLTGTLPPGRALSGLSVTGTYTTAGSYSYTLRVTDSVGATSDLAVGPVVVAAGGALLGSSPTRYSFASTRGRLPASRLAQATGTHSSGVSTWTTWTPDYPTSDPRVVYALFASDGTGDTLMSGGTITMRDVLLSLNGSSTWISNPSASFAGYAVLDGSKPLHIAPAHTGVNVPANSQIVVKTHFVPSSASVLIPRSAALQNIGGDANSYERPNGVLVANDSETNASWTGRTSGAPTGVPANTAAGQGVYFVPVAIVAKGGDGRLVGLGLGPSGTMYGTDAENAPRVMSARAASGAVDQFMDENTTTKRLAFCNFGVGGSRMLDTTNGNSLINVAPHYTQKMAALQQLKDELGDYPWDVFLIEPLLNAIPGTPTTIENGLRSVPADLRAKFPGRKYWYAEGTNLVTYAADGSVTANAPGFTFPASGSNGMVWEARRLISKISESDPTAVLRADGTWDESFTQWRETVADFSNGNINRAVPPSNFSTTLTADITAGATTIALASAPPIGAVLGYVSTGGTRAQVIVTNVVGSTYTIGAGALAAIAGTVVIEDYSKGGTHPSPRAQNIQAAGGVKMKQRLGLGR